PDLRARGRADHPRPHGARDPADGHQQLRGAARGRPGHQGGRPRHGLSRAGPGAASRVTARGTPDHDRRPHLGPAGRGHSHPGRLRRGRRAGAIHRRRVRHAGVPRDGGRRAAGGGPGPGHRAGPVGPAACAGAARPETPQGTGRAARHHLQGRVTINRQMEQSVFNRRSDRGGLVQPARRPRAKGRSSMNRKPMSVWLMAALAVVATIAAACGSTPTTGGSTPNKGKLTVAGFNFPESSILAYVYGKALEHDGYTVTYKVNLGTREVVAPALKSGQIDLYPGYAATDLEYWDQSKGLATGDVTATATQLNQ